MGQVGSTPGPLRWNDGEQMVLTYHRITPEHASYLYSVTRDQLGAHLEVVAEPHDAGGRAGLSSQVTFDDGHRSNYVYGLDLLEKHSVRATFFVTAGWTSSRDGFMSWPELRELVSLGHEVQSHGWSHRVLPECSGSELEEELERSKRTLEDQLAVPVESVSIPHGRSDDRVLKACAAAGYRRVYVSNPWMRPQQREGVEVVGRYMVRRSLQAQQLRRLLAGDPAFLFLRRSQYRIKETLKWFIGDAAYRRLWSALAAPDDVG